MSQENIDLVQRLYAAIARKDEEAVFQCDHPDVEWHDDAWLDVGPIEGSRESVRRIVASSVSSRASHSNLTISFRSATESWSRCVWSDADAAVALKSGVRCPPSSRFETEKISRTHLFSDREQALEAAGLSE